MGQFRACRLAGHEEGRLPVKQSAPEVKPLQGGLVLPPVSLVGFLKQPEVLFGPASEPGIA